MTNNTNNIQRIIAEAIYLFLIAFFCYTAVNKIINIGAFRENLMKTSLFSENIATYFSVFVIVLEVIVILILLFFKEKGLIIFCFIMLIFTLYISYLRFQGLYEVCGCGGILNGLNYNSHLVINISLIIGSLYSFYVFNNLNHEE